MPLALLLIDFRRIVCILTCLSNPFCLLWMMCFNFKRLDTNNLNGTLPSEMSVFSNLDTLSIIESSLHGTIPESFGSLSNLRLLNLSFSYMSGTISEFFTSLRKLRDLWMPYNQFTGSIPESLFEQLSSLNYISLYGNHLTGTIGELTSMPEELQLNDNLLTGSIPDSLLATSLKYFGAFSNLLSGTISSKVGQLTDLITFEVDNNNLVGFLPTQMGLMENIEWLHVNNNNLAGEIPSELGLLGRVDQLRLSHNMLAGTIPVELSSISPAEFSVEFNNISGGLDMFCNKTALLTAIGADCGGSTPKVDCPCCTKCCNESDEACETNYGIACNVHSLAYQHPDGVDYVDIGGTQCGCSSTSSIPSVPGGTNVTTMSCSDTECMSCNQDETVCGVNQEYIAQFDENGSPEYFRSEYKYIVGRNDTVIFENNKLALFEWDCFVYVNGQQCNSCIYIFCPNGAGVGYRVGCENVPGAGRFDLCGEELYDDTGVLAVFSFQDPFYMSQGSCPPRFYPVY